MAIAKSAKLIKELEAQAAQPAPLFVPNDESTADASGVIKIKPVDCLNEFIAILLFRIQSDIALPDQQLYKNEGVVVGIGPGLPDGNGGRVKSQLALGDVVVFSDRNIVMDINPNKPPYRGQRIVIISEKSLICKLPSVKYELV